MVVIPRLLMMSESHAKVDPDFGHVHRLNSRLLGSDNGLAVYLMQEILKRERSFYWPYLRVLPTPHNLQTWNQGSLLLLQNFKLVRRTASRTRQLQALYQETIGFLSSKYPELYTAERYTLELFLFAWSTVQARAFGKRLKSSALVPFADCLNHGNVQTKYDFDVGGNGIFRLFPTGTNRYSRCSEVLNSYGRRANDTLLLDYGFAMLDNEWDTAEVICSLPSFDDRPSTLDKRRAACLRASGQDTVRIFRLRRSAWDSEMLRYSRCASLSALELQKLEVAGGRQESMTLQSSPADVLHRQDSKVIGRGTLEMGYPDLCRCFANRSRQATRSQDKSNGNRSGGPGNAVMADAAAYPHLPSFGEVCEGNTGDNSILPHDGKKERERDGESEGNGGESREDRAKEKKRCKGRSRGGRGEGGARVTERSKGGVRGGRGEGGVRATERGSVKVGSLAERERVCRFPCRAMSAQNELAALKQAIDYLMQARKRFPTTLEHDEKEYQEVRAASDAPVEILNALIYRITAKRIIARQLDMADVAVALVE
ncbi:unnamed protein product, partial [Hapterophycus canaliculatus]